MSDNGHLRRPLTEADYRRMRMPHRYMEASFPEISEGEHKVYAEDYLRQIDKFVSVGWGLFLFGPPSTGKTSVAAVILKEAVRRGHTGLFQNFAEYLGTRTREFDDTVTVEDRAKAVKLLVLDEVGFKSLTPGDRRELEELVRRRIDECRATIITTNDAGENAEQACGLEFLALMKGSFYPLKVDGKDYREEEQRRLAEELSRHDDHTHEYPPQS